MLFRAGNRTRAAIIGYLDNVRGIQYLMDI